MCQLVNVKTNFDTEIEVADVKQEVIQNIVEAAKTCSNILQIILFGSAIESRCTEESDVDLVVVSDVTRSRLYRNKNYQEFLRRLHDKDDYTQQYDVICVHGLDEMQREEENVILFKEVLQNGKTLYRRA